MRPKIGSMHRGSYDAKVYKHKFEGMVSRFARASPFSNLPAKLKVV
jgi:hypothetical protein